MPVRSFVGFLLVLVAFSAASAFSPNRVEAAGDGQPTDWHRFYYYPYVYYPQNFDRQMGSYNHLYHRYSPNRQIPVYNKNWHNFYPEPEHNAWHKGHSFILDVF